ncbi:HEPN domain-containing protein [Paramicrobacterium humi]|uniref:HEPN domain-containing protein n=1 Tax=Paramicrobacterium humi TaxID=640635 RepID=A0A1H4ISQ1_9MICO|nr:HEPN domain-containing protein [Microbacterium humi]SEB37124.1 HEPN domain-containing protein [Microbacterium humi]
MIRRWEQGRSQIEGLLQRRELERVHADSDLASVHLDQARDHLAGAHLVSDRDPVGSFQLAYDAARKALAGVLIHQGLRPTSRGGHRAVEDALRAQLDPPLGRLIDRFGWMRSVRNASEYPSFDEPIADRVDASTARSYASELIDLAERLIREMPVY